VRAIPGRLAFGGRFVRTGAFAQALYRARRDAPRGTVEIAYDPIGLLYSDFVPRRPRLRIAHLHELLQYPHHFLERRLKRAIRRYDLIVVADAHRAVLTQKALGLPTLPLSIENYPLRASAPSAHHKSRRRFEVVYCGVLGLSQMLDVVVRSIPEWPPDAVLVLIGDTSTPTAARLRQLAAEVGVADRVEFLGWIDTPDAERRIAQCDLGIALLDPAFEQWRTALGASNKRFQFMKAGLPQIGDGNPGVSELLEGNRIGACVAKHESSAIAALVHAYADDPQRRAAEGARSFRLHQTEFNYERVFQRLLDRVESW
jgi:glycosyltransferase involved in cell wall biosynthesis